MIPARFAFVTFALLLSSLMSLIVSGLSTLRTLGLAHDLFTVWMTNWLVSWATAFPVVLVVAPVVQRIVGRLTKSSAHA